MASRSVSQKVEARCPACGQPLGEALPESCPLCGLALGTAPPTGEDLSPYAVDAGGKGFFGMCEWIWFAGGGRLKHLAQMRRSTASRRFARLNRAHLIVVLTILFAGTLGWHTVSNSADISPEREPQGRGWLLVAERPGDTLPADAMVALWWNPTQFIIAAVAGSIALLLLLWASDSVIRTGIELSHKSAYRGQYRMSAAVDYFSSWSVLATIGIGICWFAPLAPIATIASWSWFPSMFSLRLAGAVICALAIVMWWFWLVRLGTCAPYRTRSRVVAFLGLGPVLLLAAVLLGWWYGLSIGLHYAYVVMGIA
ncbi:MAG: hypothetical protein ACPGXK_06840 [Phycisphaerae bacterium]